MVSIIRMDFSEEVGIRSLYTEQISVSTCIKPLLVHFLALLSKGEGDTQSSISDEFDALKQGGDSFGKFLSRTLATLYHN